MACIGRCVIPTTAWSTLGMKKKARREIRSGGEKLGEDWCHWQIWKLGAWGREVRVAIVQKSRSEVDTNVTDLIAGYKELIVYTN